MLSKCKSKSFIHPYCFQVMPSPSPIVISTMGLQGCREVGVTVTATWASLMVGQNMQFHLKIVHRMLEEQARVTPT